jgi:demethylmenaquinone methyltransferase/2-methoxy-6-polyprenyl-1,4-benzoquinol methylase
MKTTFSSINALFSSIAPSYDRMNDVMSLGLHHVWKRVFVDQLPLFNSNNSKNDPWIYVDMACGSGDIGALVLERCTEKSIPISPVFIDPNPELLSIAQYRLLDQSIQWRQESAEHVSLPHHSIDLYTISFGLRNTDDRCKSLKQAYDLLVPGGEWWCLEFAHPESPWMASAFDAYLNVLPVLGNTIIGQAEPYAYLADSIRSFPVKDVFLQEICDAGFVNVTYQPLSHGIVSITRGVKCFS